MFKILFVPLRAGMEEGIKNYELRIKRAYALNFISYTLFVIIFTVFSKLSAGETPTHPDRQRCGSEAALALGLFERK